jgi:hypothetical protein
MHTVESLEQRRLFSADPIFELTSKGTLIVHGTSGNDSVIGRLFQGKSNPVQVVVKPLDPIEGSPAITHEFRGRLSAVKRLRLEGGDGGSNPVSRTLDNSMPTRERATLPGVG